MGLEILRFSQNDKLNDTLSISAVVVLTPTALYYIYKILIFVNLNYILKKQYLRHLEG